MKRVTTRIIAGMLVLGGATAGVRAYLGNQEEESFTVNTTSVTRGGVSDEVSATGTLQPVTTVQVGTEVAGTIAWLGADFNSIVRKGDIVARLDSLLLQSQVTQSRASLARATAEAENAGAQLKNARQKQERIDTLWAKQLVSANDHDAAALAVAIADAQVKSTAAQVSQASAALHQNEVALSLAVIASPIDGIIIQRNVDVGQTVSTSTSSPTIFSIAADLEHMQVNAGIDESDVARVQPAQPVQFTVDAYPGESFAGVVRQVRLEPTVVQNVTLYNVIIDVQNPGLKLRPGMTASVAIQIASRDDAVRIPNAALRFKPTAAIYAALGQAPEASRDDGGVWVFANDRLSRVPVTVGISDGQVTELVKGDLPEGATLVTNIVVGAPRVATAAPSGNIFMPTGQGGGGTRSPRG